jgi:hypothetical protein
MNSDGSVVEDVTSSASISISLLESSRSSGLGSSLRTLANGRAGTIPSGWVPRTWRARRPIPHPDRPAAASDDLLTVGADRHRPDLAGVAGQGGPLLAAAPVEDPGGPVLAAGDGLFTVGADRHRPDLAGVAGQGGTFVAQVQVHQDRPRLDRGSRGGFRVRRRCGR